MKPVLSISTLQAPHLHSNRFPCSSIMSKLLTGQIDRGSTLFGCSMKLMVQSVLSNKVHHLKYNLENLKKIKIDSKLNLPRYCYCINVKSFLISCTATLLIRSLSSSINCFVIASVVVVNCFKAFTSFRLFSEKNEVHETATSKVELLLKIALIYLNLIKVRQRLNSTSC